MTKGMHPLGFKKIPLTPRWLPFRVRLHIWTKGGQWRDDRHNHRWWFVSIPLWGSFRDVRFSPAEGNDLTHLSCAAEKQGRQISQVGTGALRQTAVYCRRPLRPYVCPREAIHSYVPRGKGWHASLVITGPQGRAASDVWRPAEVLREGPAPRFGSKR